MLRDQQSIHDILSAANEGEAANRLSDEFRATHPSIPWRDVIGMRNILAHQYDKVDIDTIWDVVHRDIPELVAMLQSMLSNLDMT